MIGNTRRKYCPKTSQWLILVKAKRKTKTSNIWILIRREKEKEREPANIYIIHWEAQSFGLDVLEFLRLVKEVVGIGLGHKPALIGLLHKVFVALLLGKGNGILLGLELEVGSLHTIGGRLPAHEGVLPPVALLQNVPVHAPVVFVPSTGLGSGLCGAVDSM